jgi:hypothetical protein
MKKITLLITLLISFFGFSQNLITNGDFANGTTNWTLDGGGAVVSGEAFFSTSSAAGDPWATQLVQGSIPFTAAAQYRLTFKSRAVANRNITVAIQNPGAWTDQFRQNFAITTTMQTYTATFSAASTFATAQIAFMLGSLGSTAGVYFDDITLVKLMPLIQNFETPVTYTSMASFNGAAASVVTDPASGAANGQVFSGVQVTGGQPWQGIEFVQTAKKAKLTTNKTMTVDVYCSQAFNILAKVDQGGAGVSASATGQAYTTPGQWQTLTFNFAAPMDNTAAANGEYAKIIFFGNWNSANTGFNNPVTPLTFYIDNIRAEETIIPTVLPLIQNFEAPITYQNVGEFGGAAAAVVVDPVTGGTNGQVLRGTQLNTGEVWQGIVFFQTAKKAKLTTNKTMTVDVYSTQAFNLLARVEVGGPNSANAQAYTTPGQWQTLTFNFNAPMDNTSVANGEYEKIVFYGNWNSANTGYNNPPVAVTYYVDNIRAEEAPLIPVAPTTAAPTPPARATADVLSFFSDAYTNQTVTTWGPSWGPEAASIVDNPIAGNATKKINISSGQTFAGIVLGTYYDLTSFTHFHIDYWIPSPVLTGQVLSFKLSNHAAQNGETSGIQALPTPQGGQWVSLDFPLANFVAASNPANLARNSIKEIVISAARLDNSLAVPFYFDNLYFHKNTTLGASNFEVAKVKLYPNPTSNILNIECTASIQAITVYNVLGQEVMKRELNNTSVALDVSGLNSGIYVVKTVVEGITSSTKFIKE